MVCPYCKRYPCACSSLFIHQDDISPRDEYLPYHPLCKTCGHYHKHCLCKNTRCPHCGKHVCRHANLKAKTSHLLNLPLNDLYTNLVSDMKEAKANMSSKDKHRMEESLHELKSVIKDLHLMTRNQRKHLIDQAHVTAEILENEKNRENFTPFWEISRHRFYLPRRFWGWRRYLNPYMWYYYRPYYW